jgi:alpha-L-fucosidase
MPTKPSKKQLEFLDWECGVFFHFGIRSFFRGHQDWDGKEMPLSAFNPDTLDCDEWIRTVKAAGFRYAILTCKHHDGFANWPSAYTEYSVKNTPWKNGEGDVVREFTDACRAHGIKVGLYYSPAQWGNTAVSFEKASDYDDYFVNQITELLTNYGKIDYLWFDSCGSAGHTYDSARIVATIRSLQPDILLFDMWDPDTRWPGNEDGYMPMPTADGFSFTDNEEGKWHFTEPRFLPAECDMKMRTTWFDSEDNEDTVKPLAELFGNYEYSVGRSANLLLNIGPNCHGRLPQKDKERLLELGAAIRAVYGNPLPFGPLEQEGDLYAVTHADYAADRPFGEQSDAPAVNRVVLREDITNGASVSAFRLYARLPQYKQRRVCIYRGDAIGRKLICAFPCIKTPRIELKIEGHDGDYRMAGIEAYYAKEL